MSEQVRRRRKSIVGVVVSDKMDKTVRVEMVRRYLHPIYKKYITSRKVLFAHDENNECKVGDRVLIMESRPLSRMKRWRVGQIVTRAQ